MIDKRFLICTYCLHQPRPKIRRFVDTKNLHIHLKLKHHVSIRIGLKNGKIEVSRPTSRKSRSKRA